MRIQSRVYKISSKQILEACAMIIMQAVLLLVIFSIRNFVTPKCPPRSSGATKLVQQAQTSQLWYYEHVYDYKPAKLTVLTDQDGAAPLRSQIPPREREITIIVGTTRDRLSAVETTAMSWGGALCLAVHVLQDSDIASLYNQLRQMHARVEAIGRCRLDIQLVQEDAVHEQTGHLYPVNGMRNMAWRMANTELIAILDADFRPSQGMHEVLTEQDTYKALVKKAIQDRHAFVLPAFEFMRSQARTLHHLDSHGLDPTSADVVFPESKEELKQGWENGTIDCFHCSFSPAGHEPTNFRKFLDPNTTTPYSITYRERFEPYLLVARASTPMFDERFRGYGKNKMAHAYECARGNDMHFQTLPNVFIFEIPHPQSSSRKYWGSQVENDFRVVGLYRRFKTEIFQLKLQQQQLLLQQQQI